MNPLKNVKALSLAMLLGVLPIIQDCRDPEIQSYPYEWLVNGSRMTYDIVSSSGNVSNARTLEVLVGTGVRPTMIFEERISGQPNDPYKNLLLLGLFSKVLAKPDGLYTTTCASCNIGACVSSKQYLKVPHQAVVFQQLPEYACGETVAGYDVVISVDSLVRLPIGEFETIVILDTLSQTVKFWNEKNGLIRVDNFSEAVDDTVKLVLSNKNF